MAKYTLSKQSCDLPYIHKDGVIEIEAWMTPNEINELQKLCINKKYIEIGTYRGFSAWQINKVAYSLVLIDLFTKNEDIQIKQILRNEYDSGKIWLIKGFSQKISNQIYDNQYDVLLIDGSHNYEDVRKDYVFYRQKVIDGGYICFHDYTPTWQGVVDAVDNVVVDEYIDTIDTLIIFRKVTK